MYIIKMENRTFFIKKNKWEHGTLIDIKATVKNRKREGHYIANTWMGSLTIEEAKDIHQKLGKVLEE